MEPSRRRGCRQVAQQVTDSCPTLPYSCLEIPDEILPDPAAASGFIVADGSSLQSTPCRAGCGRRCGADAPSAALRVLWLPTASLLPPDGSPDNPLDLVRRLLLQQSNTRKDTGTALPAEAREDYLRASVLRLSRQARLALDVLAGGYRIAGVWLRTDLGQDKLEESVAYKPNQYSFIRSLAYAITKAHACDLRESLNPGRAASLCCFVFFSSHSAAGGAVKGGRNLREFLCYYPSGSAVTTTEFRRLPVVILQDAYLQIGRPLNGNIVYSTCLPAQVELCFIPTESFLLSTQKSCQQLCVALASELYADIVAVFSPPVLASSLIPAPGVVRQSIPHAQHGHDLDSSTRKEKVYFRCVHHKDRTHRTCTLPQNVAESLPCDRCANSTSPSHSGSPDLSERPDYFRADLSVYTKAPQPPCLCVIWTSLSECWRDEYCGQEHIAQASSDTLQVCSLQPLLVGDVVFRYRVFLETPFAEEREGNQSNVLFRVQPCVLSSGLYTESLADFETPQFSPGGLSHMCWPLIQLVKSEFVAAVIAPVSASLEYLRKALAADAAAAIARRVVDSLADTCATHSRSTTKQRPHVPGSAPGKDKVALSRNVAPLEARRFYTFCLGGKRQGKKCDEVVTALLLNDFDIPGETAQVAVQAAAERFEVLLGIPRSAVFPHTCLKDGYATVSVCAEDSQGKALVAYRRKQQHHLSNPPASVIKKHSVLPSSRMETTPADAFWNAVENRARRRRILQLEMCASVGSVRHKRRPRRSLYYGCVIVLAVVLVARLLFPLTNRST